MLIRKGQTSAKLTELRLNERGADQIMGRSEFMEAKRKQREHGLTPMELASKDCDGDILGKNDRRTGKSGKVIAKQILSEMREEMDAWLAHPDHKLNNNHDVLRELETLDLQALAHAFRDVFSTSKVPGKTKRVEFGI